MNYFLFMEKERIVEIQGADAVSGMPVYFSIDDNKYMIEPPTIGKMSVMSKYFLRMGLTDTVYSPGKESFREFLDLSRNYTEEMSMIISIATFSAREDILNMEKVTKRADYFKWNLNFGSMCKLLMCIFSLVDFGNFMKAIRSMRILRLNRPMTGSTTRIA